MCEIVSDCLDSRVDCPVDLVLYSRCIDSIEHYDTELEPVVHEFSVSGNVKLDYNTEAIVCEVSISLSSSMSSQISHHFYTMPLSRFEIKSEIVDLSAHYLGCFCTTFFFWVGRQVHPLKRKKRPTQKKKAVWLCKINYLMDWF